MHKRSRSRFNQGHVLEIAFKLFAERGFDGVTTRMISKTTGLSIATIYHYFPTKEALYVAAIKYAYADSAEKYKELLSSGLTPLQRLRKMIELYAVTARDEPDVVKLVKREQLEGNPERMRMLANSPLGEQAEVMHRIVADVFGREKAQMISLSIMGMILHRYEALHFWPQLKHHSEEHLDPLVVAEHVYRTMCAAHELLNEETASCTRETLI